MKQNVYFEEGLERMLFFGSSGSELPDCSCTSDSAAQVHSIPMKLAELPPIHFVLKQVFRIWTLSEYLRTSNGRPKNTSDAIKRAILYGLKAGQYQELFTQLSAPLLLPQPLQLEKDYLDERFSKANQYVCLIAGMSLRI